MPLDQPEAPGGEMSFLDHLEALRWHLVRVAIAVTVFTIAAFIFSDFIFDKVILAPMYADFATYRFFCYLSETVLQNDSICIRELNFELININMAGQFTTHLVVSFFSGLILAFPYLLYEIWRFIKPALYAKERKYATGLIFWGSVLFLSGIAFGYYLIAPLSINFFGNYRVSQLVDNQIHLGSFMDTVLTTTFGSGLVFELPVIIYFLARIGLVTQQSLRSMRRLSYVIILVVAAIITPPDVLSQILVAIPLFILYEISIVIAGRVARNR